MSPTAASDPIDWLASFKGGAVGTTAVRSDDFSSKVLELAIPEAPSAAQQEVLDRMAHYAVEKGVEVVVTVY